MKTLSRVWFYVFVCAVGIAAMAVFVKLYWLNALGVSGRASQHMATLSPTDVDTPLHFKRVTWGIGSGDQIRFLSCDSALDEEFDSTKHCYFAGFGDVYYRAGAQDVVFAATDLPKGRCPDACASNMQFMLLTNAELADIKRNSPGNGFHRLVIE